MKISRSDILHITKSEFSSRLEEPIGNINYDRWVKFIEEHKDCFIWYKDTEDGICIKDNIENIPDWARVGMLHQLNKTCAYSTNKMSKKSEDIRIVFNVSSI